MKIIFGAFLIFSTFAHGSADAKDCLLESGDHKLRLVTETCEFPEGNKTACAQVQAEHKTKTPRKGPVVFRKGSDFNSFCLSAKDKEPKSGKLARIISSSRSDKLKAYLICPSLKDRATIVLTSEKKRKSCDLEF